MESSERISGVYPVGHTIDGKYVVDRVLGEGGMGVVYAAHHSLLGTAVALKVLRSFLVAHDDSVRRVTREAQSMARLTSPHVARVLDVGAGPEGSPYLVMELLEGEDLGTKLKEKGTFPPEEAAGFVLEACLGLAEAHAVGIIHRDLKPANLFLARLPAGSTQIKIVDFGISKLVDYSEATLTSPDTLLGSPAYMAPEQLASAHHVDARADIWSLGAILFRLTTGQHALAADSSFQRLHALLRDEPRRLREVMPGAPADLDAIVARCLVRDPSGRYPTVKALATDLAAFLGVPAPELPTPPRSTTPPPQISPIRDAPTRKEVGHALRARPGRRRRFFLVAIGVTTAALLIALYLERGPSKPEIARTNQPALAQTSTPPPSTEPSSTSSPPAPASATPPSASEKTPPLAPAPPRRPATPLPPSSNPFDGRL